MWRRTKLFANLNLFKASWKRLSFVVKKSRQEYYQHFNTLNSTNQWNQQNACHLSNKFDKLRCITDTNNTQIVIMSLDYLVIYQHPQLHRMTVKSHIGMTKESPRQGALATTTATATRMSKKQ